MTSATQPDPTAKTDDGSYLMETGRFVMEAWFGDNWNRMPSYTYRPLSRTQVEARILVLKAARSRINHLRCSLIHVSLNWMKDNTYETISYCWGDSTKTPTIEVDGHIMRIPSNAEEAIRCMNYSRENRVLWIDSVCINQEDLDERSQQVAQMHLIYRNAKKNLVWLGGVKFGLPESQNIKVAVDLFLEHMENETNNYETFESTVYGANRRPGRELAKSIKNNTPLKSDTFTQETLLKLYSRPWFRRLWVLQEVALARSSVCYCGKWSLPLNDLLRVASWMFYQRYWLLHTGPEFESNMQNLAVVTVLADYGDSKFGRLKNKSRKHRAKSNFSDLLLNVPNFGSKNPRDRVFGLLGLYRNTFEPENLPGLLQPDYRKSVRDVFADATRHAIMESGRLDALTLVRRRLYAADQPNDRSGGRRWPSWVPVWDEQLHPEIDANSLRVTFRASSDTEATVGSTLLDSEVLELFGILVDGPHGSRIACNTAMRSDYIYTFHVDVEKLIDTFRSSTSIPLGPWDLPVTLVAGIKGEYAGSTVELGRADEDSFHGFKCFRQYFAEYGELPPSIRKLESPHKRKGRGFGNLLGRQSHPHRTTVEGYASQSRGRGGQDELAAARYLEDLLIATKQRKFFITAAGRIGLGPKELEESDIVVVLYGADTPFVLRPVANGFYEIIGQCYVHNIMDGEVIQQSGNGSHAEAAFCLK